MKKLSVIIPCYNEALNIPLVLDGFKRVIARNDIEIIFVDNNSSDGTAAVLKDLLPLYSFSRSVFEPRAGYGSAIIAGLRAAQGIYIGWTHADMQAPPADVIQALKIIEKMGNPEKIYIKGKRTGRPLFDIFFTMGMSVFETLYLGVFMRDINGQPNLFHRNFFKDWDDPPMDFSLDLYAYYLLKRKEIPIKRFPVKFLQRTRGVSSWNTGFVAKWQFIKRTLYFSKKLRKQLKRRKS